MKIKHWIALTGFTAVLCLCVGRVQSQPAPSFAGGFDPSKMQQMMMDGYREQLEITNADEWQAIQPRIQKVLDCRREMGAGGMGMMARMFRRAAGGNGPPEGAPAGGGAPGFGAFGPKPGPEEEALQTAIDSKASKEVVKAALAKFLDARKAKQAKLEAAQADLRNVLTPRQEAIAALSGLL
jgi:hypothetical protein